MLLYVCVLMLFLILLIFSFLIVKHFGVFLMLFFVYNYQKQYHDIIIQLDIYCLTVYNTVAFSQVHLGCSYIMQLCHSCDTGFLGATWQLPAVQRALFSQIEIHLVCIWGLTTAQAIKSPTEKNAVINIFLITVYTSGVRGTSIIRPNYLAYVYELGVVTSQITDKQYQQNNVSTTPIK